MRRLLVGLLLGLAIVGVTANADTIAAYYQRVTTSGTAVTRRPTLNFVGATVADDAANKRTTVTIASPAGTYAPLASPTFTGAVTLAAGVPLTGTVTATGGTDTALTLKSSATLADADYVAEFRNNSTFIAAISPYFTGGFRLSTFNQGNYLAMFGNADGVNIRSSGGSGVSCGVDANGGNAGCQWVGGAWVPGADNAIAIGSSAARPTQVWGMAHPGAEETVSFSATPNFNCTTGGEHKRIVLTGNVTSWTMTNGLPSQNCTISWIQDGGGSHTTASPGANILLSGGSITITATASKRSCITLRWDVTSTKWVEIARSLNL
jgi:hypothetical protein